MLEELKQNEIQKERSLAANKSNVVILLALFTLIISVDFLAKFEISPLVLLTVKLVLGLLAIATLSK